MQMQLIGMWFIQTKVSGSLMTHPSKPNAIIAMMNLDLKMLSLLITVSIFKPKKKTHLIRTFLKLFIEI